ncbi:FAD:protein FMN transferase [Paenochrobactrum sp. BZR 588]
MTVVAENCMLADAWATALMVKGRAEGSELARKMGFEVLIVERND